MSILQQILDKMFVDPEILEALDEEQKQILFIKMREEQIKRWKSNEEKLEKESEKKTRKTSDGSKRRVKWLFGKDDEVWVWVMGEHKDDLTIEQITERRELQEARNIAEKEMLERKHLEDLYITSDPVLLQSEDEKTLKQQLSRMEPWNDTSRHKIEIEDSMYENTDATFASTVDMQWPLTSEDMANEDSKNVNIALHQSEVKPQASLGDTFRRTDYSSSHTKYLSENELLEKPLLSNSSLLSDSANGTSPLNFSSLEAVKRQNCVSSEMTNSCSKNSLCAAIIVNEVPILDRKENHGNNLLGDEKEVSFEVGTIKNVDNDNESNEKIIESKLLVGEFPTYPGAVKLRAHIRRKSEISDIDEEINKRQSEIYEKIKEKKQLIDREAEIDAECIKRAWESQEKKAREAEAQIRRIAQRAREQHRQHSLRTSSSILPLLKNVKAGSLREALRSLPHPPKPKSKEAIITWFKIEEWQRGSGLDPTTQQPAAWFHGIISRSKADELLRSKRPSSFLVRVSERIWGYTVSYIADGGNIKHFLIEKIPQGYQFLGTNQVVHKYLHELVAYHKVYPITAKGNEILRWAVGQIDSVPDYSELIPS